MRGFDRLRECAKWAQSAPFDLASLILGLGLSVLLTATFSDYSFTYDEPNHIRYGEHILDYWTSGFADRRALEFSRYYGGGFDLFAALTRRILPIGEFDANHFACLLVALVGLWGTWSLGRFLAGACGGFLALLFVVLTPVYYAHQFNNMKDLPFAVGYVCAVRAVLGWVRALPRPSWGATVALGLGLGCAMSVRVAGIAVIAYLLLAMGVWWAGAPWRRRSAALSPAARGASREDTSPVAGLLRAGAATAIGWLVMVLPWPWALQSPLVRPFQAFSRFSGYSAFTSGTLLHGKEYPAQDVPWDYLPTYFAIQLNPLVLALMLLGSVALALSVAVALRRREALPTEAIVVLVACWLPPVYAIVKGATLYDGVRQYLFLVPLFCVLASTGLTEVLKRLPARSWVRGTVALGVAASLLPTALSMWRLHPYQHLHFNLLGGGLTAAAERYETEYYGSVYGELHRRLGQWVWERDGEAFLSRDYKVTGCGTNEFFSAHLPANFRFVSQRDVAEADFFSTYRRYNCHKRHKQFPIVLTLEQDGVTLGVVRAVKPPGLSAGSETQGPSRRSGD